MTLMSFDQLSVVEMLFGKMPAGQIPIGQIHDIQISVDQMSVGQIVFNEKTEPNY
jgi:hypothetical protein